MHRKGSMELSVNSIVILVIAVVMMGLILGFIRSKFADVSGGFVVDESSALEASASNPIMLSRNLVVVSGTQKTGLNINFYNTHTANIMNTKPYWHCKPTTATPVIDGEYFTKSAQTSSMTEYTGNIKLATSVPKDTYLCTACFTRQLNPPPGSTCESLTQSLIVARKEFQLIVQ